MKKENTEKPAYKKDYLYMAYRGKEYLWLAFTGIALVTSIYQLIKGTREEAIYFIALTVLAGLFYSFNRYRRIRFEKRAAEQAQKNN
jgi:hypothetical protein